MSQTTIESLFPQEIPTTNTTTTNLLQNFQIPTLILFFLPLIIFLLYSKLNPFLTKSPPLPPGPFAWPIFGNLFQLGSNPHQTLTQWAQTYGPILSFRLGPKLVVVGSSPEAASEILRTHDKVLSARFVPHVSPARCMELKNCSIGWVSECDEDWRNVRTFCRTELFSGKSIASQAQIREKKVEEMLGFVREMEGRALKIREVSFATALNALSNILVSRDLARLDREGLSGGICVLMQSMTDVASALNISDFYPVLGRFDLQGLQKRARGLCHTACKLWEKIMQEKEETKKNNNDYNGIDNRIIDSCPGDFLDALVKNGFSGDQINVLFVELFAAGTETSSSTVEWLMAELIRSPRCMKKLREELDREIGQRRSVKESDLPNLTYLQACFKETLRFRPVGPLLLPHRAAESCHVMGFSIPKDSQILVNVSAIGLDPKVWDSPSEFRPERFLIDGSVLRQGLDFKGADFEYFPFGSGRRMCPGMPLAAKQIPLLVAALIQSFDWALPEGMAPSDMDMTEKYGIAMRMKQPLRLVPTPRAAK